MSFSTAFSPGDYRLIHDGTCAVLHVSSAEGRLRSLPLDDRYPFSLWEASYQAGRLVYVPQGAALGAKMLSLATWLGPLRLEMGIPFTVGNGMAFDPVWDPEKKGFKVTHRSATKTSKAAPKIILPDGSKVGWSISQHGYQPERGAHGSAWDFRPAGCDEPMREEITAWLKKRGKAMEPFQMDGRTIKDISIGVYGDNNGNFVHADLRPGAPGRWRSGAPKTSRSSAATGDVARWNTATT